MDWEQPVTDVLRRLETRAAEATVQPCVEDLGHVIHVGDGVAIVSGLATAMLDELVVFAGGVQGQVLDLGRDTVACILFGPEEGVAAGTPVFRTGQVAAVPVGPEVLGRVIDPFGRPRDGRGPIVTAATRPVEQEAPGPLEREPVHEPLLTGIKAIDAAVPIGLGQRQLILGDRATGKTSLALDMIINQHDTGVICIYASIGSKRVAAREILEELGRHDALGYTIMVLADAAEPAPLRYLAPYAAATLAEWFAARGRHVLVVYDDLTRHAEAYRSLSLLLRRPPSREAYPGDIFYLHARLMERAFRLKDALGGGSVTALPILETQRGNIAGFIPTNLISMTDGQFYLDADLFAQGQLPAIDIGKSVSRVGGAAQPDTLREAAANLRLELSQYEEVKGFARFGAILDETTRRQLERGRRLTAILRQPERAPLPLAVEVAVFWAFKTGLLDDLAPEHLATFEQRLRAIGERFPVLPAQLRSAAGLGEALTEDLSRWVASAKAAASVPAGGRYER